MNNVAKIRNRAR